MEERILSIDEIISPNDHMLTAGREAYFRTSRSGLECVLSGLSDASRDPESIGSVLDFGCGYGRVYRALAAAFPTAQLTACDLEGEAARFCAATFGGDWVTSSEDFHSVRLPRRYDLIWLGSVFTHLPAWRWPSLLDFLAGAAATDGVVVFSSHGMRSIHAIENGLLRRNPHVIDATSFSRMKQILPLIGFCFFPSRLVENEYRRRRGREVSEGEYGLSFATEEWVCLLIDKLPQWELLSYVAAGWADNHDVVTVRRL